MRIGIIASGPSVTEVDVAALARMCDEVGVVNSSYIVAPWADWLYTNDHDWLESEHMNIVSAGFTAPIYCGHPHAFADKVKPSQVDLSYRFYKSGPAIMTKPGLLKWGGNSGYAAINLAWHRGAREVYLLGYDQKGAHYTAHHHPPHKQHVQKPFNFPFWREEFENLAREAHEYGLKVVNCTRDTALTCFTRAKFKHEEHNDAGIDN